MTSHFLEEAQIAAKEIKAIDKTSVHRICSGQVVLTLATAVKELVENSIDAGSTIIDVRLKEYGLEMVEVSDNGSGVEEQNFQGLTLKHHTSKIQEFSDVVNVETFGFRGEALSSLCALSTMTILTRHTDASVGTKLAFDNNGKITSKVPQPRQKGTTVTMQNLFFTLPVRHKEFQRNLKKEFAKMVQVLNSYCIISTGIRITCTNQPKKGGRNTVVSSSGNASMKENITNVFGPKQMHSLMEFTKCMPTADVTDEFSIKISEEGLNLFCIEGFVSKCAHGLGRSSTDRQFLFINRRPCDSTKLSKVINEVYHQYNRHQYPFVALHITMNKEHVDVNVTPDKRQIFMQDEKVLLAVLKSSLIKMYEPTVSSYPVSMISKPTVSESSSLLLDKKVSEGLALHSEGASEKEKNRASEVDNQKCPLFTSTETVNERKLDFFVFQKSPRKDTVDIRSHESPTVKQFNEQKECKITSPTPNDWEKSDSEAKLTDCVKSDKSPCKLKFIPKESESMDEGCVIIDQDGDHSSVLSQTKHSEYNNNQEQNIELQVDASGDCKVIYVPICENIPLKLKPESKTDIKSFVETESESNKGGNFTLKDEVDGDCLIDQKLRSDSASSQLCSNSSASFQLCSENISRAQVCSDSVTNAPMCSNHQSYDPLCPEKLAYTQMCADNDCDVKNSSSSCPDRRVEDSRNSPTSYSGGSSSLLQETCNLTVTSIDKKEHSQKKEVKVEFNLEKLKENVKSNQRKRDSGAEYFRRFRAKISPTDNQSAEEELSREIKKSMFSEMEILGQFNLGFIIVRLQEDLFIVDQHATDEKYNFEMLQQHTVIQCQKLIQPQNLELTASSETILIDNLDVFKKNGFDFIIDEEAPPMQRVKLLSIPVSKNWTFGKEDIEELIFMLTDSPNVMCRPTRVRQMFASRACRKSIMIGTALKKSEMKRLVCHMGEIDQPWNCPHGRPTMRHLISLNMVPH